MKYMLVCENDVDNSNVLGTWREMPTLLELEDVLHSYQDKKYIVGELRRNGQVYLHDNINTIIRLIELEG